MSPGVLRPVILVEDNPMDADLAMRAFRKCGLANPVEILRDGQEALKWLAGLDKNIKAPVVILLDLKLPKVDGLEVLKALRTTEACKLTPVVVLTTSTNDRDVRAAYEGGANSYIVKPVDYDEFIEVVHHIKLYWLKMNRLPD